MPCAVTVVRGRLSRSNILKRNEEVAIPSHERWFVSWCGMLRCGKSRNYRGTACSNQDKVKVRKAEIVGLAFKLERSNHNEEISHLLSAVENRVATERHAITVRTLALFWCDGPPATLRGDC